MWNLEDVLDVLNEHRQRATYGAVAGVVGGIARGVMHGRTRCPRDSWVVRKRGRLPSGYTADEKHSDLLLNPRVIDIGEELRLWLSRPN